MGFQKFGTGEITETDTTYKTAQEQSDALPEPQPGGRGGTGFAEEFDETAHVPAPSEETSDQ